MSYIGPKLSWRGRHCDQWALVLIAHSTPTRPHILPCRRPFFYSRVFSLSWQVRPAQPSPA